MGNLLSTTVNADSLNSNAKAASAAVSACMLRLAL